MNDDLPDATAFCVVTTTVATETDAEALAREIVAARLGACVQIQMVRSYFVWEDQACAEPEYRLDIKTRRSLYSRIEAFIGARHPYDTPEILATPLLAGSARYLRWLADGTKG